MFEQIMSIDRMEEAISLFGNFDENIKDIEKRYNVVITNRGSQIKISGDPNDVLIAVRTVECLIEMINKGEQITDQSIQYADTLSKVTLTREPAVITETEDQMGVKDTVYLGADKLVYYTLQMWQIAESAVQDAQK